MKLPEVKLLRDRTAEEIVAAELIICQAGKESGIGFFGRHPHLGFSVAAQLQADLTEREHQLLAALKENARLTANPKVGDCIICGTSIWSNQPRMDNGSGLFHPLCEVGRKLKQAESTIALRDTEIARLKENLDRAVSHIMAINIALGVPAGKNSAGYAMELISELARLRGE